MGYQDFGKWVIDIFLLFLKDLFALKMPSKTSVLLSFFGTIFISLFSGLLITKLIEIFPNHYPERLQSIDNSVNSSVGLDYLYLVFFLCIFVPIIEELVFRGVLWKMFEIAFSPVFAILFVSILFALAHGDIMHVIGVFPVGLWMGWLRLRTKSILPSIIAHATNNSIATFALISINIGV